MAKPKAKSDAKSKRPYTVTDKVMSANRENSTRSTGPKSAEGRKRVGQNSRTHGLTAQEVVIEGEDPEELMALGNLWVASMAGETPIEIHLGHQAALAFWRLRRAIIADACALRGQILDIRRSHRDRQTREVAKLVARLAEAPTDVVTRLRESAAGCAYLVEQWTRIADRLKHSGSVLRSERERAVRLLGKRLCDLFDDDQVENWNLAYLASLPLPDGQKADLKLAHEVFDTDRPDTILPHEFDIRLARWVEILPNREKAVAMLNTTVAQTLAELNRRRKALEAEEAERLEIDAGAATVDKSIEGGRRLKYQKAHEREMLKLLEMAKSLRFSRLAGKFQEMTQIGMSAELIALMAAGGLVKTPVEVPEPADAADSDSGGDAAGSPATIPAEDEPAQPATSEMPNIAVAVVSSEANSDLEIPADLEFQSKPDSAPPVEPKMPADPGVTAESSAKPKPIARPAVNPLPGEIGAFRPHGPRGPHAQPRGAHPQPPRGEKASPQGPDSRPTRPGSRPTDPGPGGHSHPSDA